MDANPQLYKRTIAETTAAIEAQLSMLQWRGRQGGIGQAIAQLYGRLAEVMANRLNQAPEQHFRAFLNEAGIDRVAPRAAGADIVFAPAPDGPPVIPVPKGTQLTAPPTDTRPEIVFETERALNVVPTTLVRCIVVDQLNSSDRSAQARGEVDDPFASFTGEEERPRVLYIGHDKLFTFTADADRANAQVVLHFTFDTPGVPSGDGEWRIDWYYWNGDAWTLLQAPATEIRDNTENFSKNGSVVFINLPPLQKSILENQETVWLAAQLTGGTGREHLPRIAAVQLHQEVLIPPPELLVAPALVPLPAGALIYDHHNKKEQRYYIGHETLFSLPDTIRRRRAHYTLTFRFTRAGSPSIGEGLQVEWLYWHDGRWQPLAASGAAIDDRTARLSKDGLVTLKQLPPLMPSTEAGLTDAWLAVRLTSTQSGSVTPIIEHVEIRRAIPAEPASIKAALAAVQAGSIFVPLDPKGPLTPLGAIPLPLDSFYLRIDDAFTKARATVTLQFTLAGLPTDLADTSNLDRLTIVWEYFSEDGWVSLGSCVRGCPTLEAYQFDSEPAFGKPKIVTVPFTRRKVLEFAIPAGVDPNHLPAPFARGKVITDIYSGEHFVQIPIPPECINLPEELLINGCYKADRLNFRDKTCAFTATGPAVVEFTVPAVDSADPHFAPTEVGGQAGYWIRARVAAGSYDVPQKGQQSLLARAVQSQPAFLPPITYAPVIRELHAEYSNYYDKSAPHPLRYCLSRTDTRWQDHQQALRRAQPFSPYRAVVAAADVGAEAVSYELLALYLGFHPLLAESEERAFPPGYWIELLIDLEEAANGQKNQLQWEYWNGKCWRKLRADDKTMGLTRRNYFGFIAPIDHAPSIEFAQRGYWFRIRPADRVDQPTGQETTSDKPLQIMPRLRTIRLNSVPAMNSETLTEELLGSSSGAPSQLFTLARTPVLSDVEIEVREPDQRTESETAQLGATNGAGPTTGTLQVITAPTGHTHEGWVLWQPVTSFHRAGPNDRYYLVDQESGQIRFGDGRRGRIPPPGIDNIRARRYRTHASDHGNLAAGAIAELRNPSGVLNDIQAVTNLARTAGGFAVEEIARAKVRGPHTLKNRERAVTAEDYQWLALEIDGVERAHGIPTHKANGAVDAGSVTVMIIPKPSDALPENVARKLVPTPALLRLVERHLADRILANLRRDDGSDAINMTDVDHIYVVGPQYIAVQVAATVIPIQPEAADSVRIAVLTRLDEFLHPVHGGPHRDGWQPGRAVYLSEIAAEVEQVAGVDHVLDIRLAGEALLHQSLVVTEPVTLCTEMPAGSQVATFDGQRKLILTNPLPAGPLEGARNGAVGQTIHVHGFKRDDPVAVVTEDNLPLFAQLQVDQVSPHGHDQAVPAGNGEPGTPATDLPNCFDITFRRPVLAPKAYAPAGTALYTDNKRVRLTIVESHIRFAANCLYFTGVTVVAFGSAEHVSLIHAYYPYREQDFLAVRATTNPVTSERAARIVVPSDHLVYSGEHSINVETGK